MAKGKTKARKVATRDSKARPWLGVLENPWTLGWLLAAVVFALYWPSLGSDFVWDGRAVILTNSYVHGLRHLPDVLTLRVMHQDVIDNNRPVFLLTVMLEWALWGANPFGYHLTNLLLHALATVLLFAWLRKLLNGGPPWVPFFAALIFAVHPVNCEAVAEVSYRKDLIATAGLLAALNFAAIFQPVFTRRNFLLGAACVACLLVAVGTKENGVAGPFALGAYWLLFRRGEPRRGWIALVGVSLLAVTAFMIARFTLPPWPSVIFTQKPLRLGGSVASTLLIQPRIWAFYFRQIVWPLDLCGEYNAYSIRNFNLGLSLAALIAVLGGQIYIASKSRVACLGVALFWLSLLPVSNFIPIYRPMADRFLYMPMCGVALMLAALGGMPWLHARLMAAAACTAACVLAAVTFRQENVWRNSFTLWTDAAAKNPVSFTAANNLAETLLNRGDFAGAVDSADKAVRLTGAREANPFATAAVALDHLGKTANADAAYRKAAELDARYREPEKLVEALILTPEEAQQLEVIARRNL
jgi:hypothetical protein